MKTIQVTGSAEFIDADFVLRLPRSQETARNVRLDNVNGYYNPSLKQC